MPDNNETTTATTTEIKQEEKKTLSLAERAKNITTRKDPTVNSEPVQKPIEKGTAAPKTKVSKNWDFADDFEEKPKPTAADPKEKKEESEEEISEKEKIASAETAVGTLDFLLTSIFTPIARAQFKKKFTNDEWPRVKEMQWADPKKLSADDVIFHKKVHTYLKEFKEKLNKIELSPDETRKNEKAAYVYFDATNTKMSPAVLAITGLITTIGTRITDALFD